MPTTLQLIAGLYSASIVGGTVLDPEPDPIDLLGGTFRVEQVSGVPAYSPAIAGLKNGGVWDDPGNRDGRELSFSAKTNVTETISLTAASGDILARNAAISKFNLFAHWARKFNEDLTTDPKAISIMYDIDDGAGPQYAQVFNIEVAPDFRSGDIFGLPYLSGVVLTIERGKWQGIPIGASPRIWTLEALRHLTPTNGTPSASQYNHSHLSLVEISPSAGYENAVEKTIYNVCEYGAGAVGSLRDNFVDIPPSVIAGDDLCLASVVVLAYDGGGGDSGQFKKLHVALKTNPQNNPGSPAINVRNTYNGGDASSVNNTTGVTVAKVSVTTNRQQGIRSNGSNTNHHYLRFTVGTGAVLSTTSYNALWPVDPYSMRGSYNVYFRGGTDSGGSTNQMRLMFNYITAGSVVGTPNIEIGEITPIELPDASSPQLSFIGTLNIPESAHYKSNPEGLGAVSGSMYGRLGVRAYRSSGTTSTTIRLFDIILMPFDEGQVIVMPFESATTGSSTRGVAIDSTQYVNRTAGEGIHAIGFQSPNYLFLPPSDLSGRPLKLKPGLTNRLYFLAQDQDGDAGTALTMRAIVHPVPTWNGLRDA